MGYLAIGSFSEGWTLLAGEVLPSDLEVLGLVPDPSEAQHKRGPRAILIPRHTLVEALLPCPTSPESVCRCGARVMVCPVDNGGSGAPSGSDTFDQEPVGDGNWFQGADGTMTYEPGVGTYQLHECHNGQEVKP